MAARLLLGMTAMADTEPPPLYDEAHGLREIARARMKRDALTRGQVQIADRLAEWMHRHFAAEETETAGRALLVGAASVAALAEEGIEGAVLVNILGFTAGRMVSDGRAWTEAQHPARCPTIPWGRDASIEQGIPTQIGYTAHLGDHLFTLLGDTSKTPAGEWVAQVDGRLISDGRTDRESATQAAEQRWMELSGDA